MDTSDTARLLRVLAVRAFILALLSGVTGASLPALVFAVTGLGLLLVPLGPAADRRADRCAAPGSPRPSQSSTPQSTSSSTSAETGSKRTGRLLIPVRRLE